MSVVDEKNKKTKKIREKEERSLTKFVPKCTKKGVFNMTQKTKKGGKLKLPF